MYTYIHINALDLYTKLEYNLEDSLREIDGLDQMGTTYQDYLNGKWVHITDEMLEFKKANPNATIELVLAMSMPEPTIEEVRADILFLISRYDTSKAVNSFTINGITETWFNPQVRSNYKSSIEAAKLCGIDKIQFFVNDMLLDISTELAELLLAQVQLYADKCFIVTKQHVINVNNLSTIEELKSYDFTTGYPEKLNFNL